MALLLLFVVDEVVGFASKFEAGRVLGGDFDEEEDDEDVEEHVDDQDEEEDEF